MAESDEREEGSVEEIPGLTPTTVVVIVVVFPFEVSVKGGVVELAGVDDAQDGGEEGGEEDAGGDGEGEAAVGAVWCFGWFEGHG